MRLLIATVISLFVCAVFFVIIKIWGTSQPYIAYSHPLFDSIETPLIFKVVTPESMNEALKTESHIYLNIAVTQDQKLIVIDRQYETEKKIQNNSNFRYHNLNYADVISTNSKSAVLLETFKNQLSDKKIIFNMQDNPLQGTTVFIDMMKILNMDAGKNFIFVSPYDPPTKDLKSMKPTYLFGASEPEILKIKALESLYLIEAANFRADVIIYPLTYYKQPFFTETLIKNLERRHKKFIIGPIVDSEYENALKLKPFGIIKN